MTDVKLFCRSLLASMLGLFLFNSFPLSAQTIPPEVPAASGKASGNSSATESDFSNSSSSLTSFPEMSPVVAVVLKKIKEPSFADLYSQEDIDAAFLFYSEHPTSLWVGETGYTDKGMALVKELDEADLWGLDLKAFHIPDNTVSLTTTEGLAEAETKATLAALTYARFAKGGRVTPSTISQLLDLTPPLRDPKVVISEIATAPDPSTYLKNLHPQHQQFKRLRAELIKRLGPKQEEKAVKIEPPVTLPEDGATLKPGSLHPDITLLRQRLKIPANFAGQDTLYDQKLAVAVKVFQSQNRLKPTALLNKQTRLALNKDGSGEKPGISDDTLRLKINMERWRWMPEDLGDLHVINNIPEYVTRTYNKDQILFKEKLIVGQPTWPTPSFSSQMKTVIFNPSWGVPDGIKAKELGPRLARAGGGNFFEQLFGGGSGGASVLRAYGLTAYRNGKPVDPESVNWSQADLRAYSFVQPPGGQNPLGFVKFIFPNSHDVYMHDTTQRNLFAESRRPFSHGCIRVNNPGKFAEVLLAEDRGWSADRVAQARQSSETIELEKAIFVHNVYLTIWVDEDGAMQKFADVYGLDSRVSHALVGKSVRSFDGPADDRLGRLVVAEDGTTSSLTPASKSKTKKKFKSPPPDFIPTTLFEAMAGLVSN